MILFRYYVLTLKITRRRHDINFLITHLNKKNCLLHMGEDRENVLKRFATKDPLWSVKSCDT